MKLKRSQMVVKLMQLCVNTIFDENTQLVETNKNLKNNINITREHLFGIENTRRWKWKRFMQVLSRRKEK